MDLSSCITVGLSDSIVDSIIASEVLELVDSIDELGFQQVLVPGATFPFSEDDFEERAIVSTWSPGVIEYYLPLRLIIPKFFDADWDVHAELRFTMEHSEEDSELNVDIDHRSDVRFDVVEHVLTLGSATVVQKTADKLLPLVLDCELRSVERAIARQLIGFYQTRLTTHRLYSVRVVGEQPGLTPNLEFTFCPSRPLPVVPHGGDVGG